VNAIKPMIKNPPAATAARRIKATDITHIHIEFVLVAVIVVIVATREGGLN